MTQVHQAADLLAFVGVVVVAVQAGAGSAARSVSYVIRVRGV